MAWNLKKPFTPYLDTNSNRSQFRHIHVSPGTYKVTLYSIIEGDAKTLGTTQTFEVERIRNNTLKNPISNIEINNYINELEILLVAVQQSKNQFEKASTKLKTFEKALTYLEKVSGELEQQIFDLNQTLQDIKTILEGSSSKQEIGEKDVISIMGRLSTAQSALFKGTYGPTKMHLESFDIAKILYNRVNPKIIEFAAVAIPYLEKQLVQAGAPVIID